MCAPRELTAHPMYFLKEPQVKAKNKSLEMMSDHGIMLDQLGKS
jgi:hypothetical protein